MSRLLACFVLAVAVAGLAGCRDARTTKSGSTSTMGETGATKAADLAPADLDVMGPGLHKVQAKAPTGKSVKYAIHVPANLPKGGKVPLVVALHYAGKKSDWYGAGMVEGMYAEGCESLGAIIVGPDSLSGDDWDTQVNVDHVVWLTKSVLKSYPIDPKKVVLSGFSAGGVGTWYIAPRTDLFTAAIPVAGEPTLKGAEWAIPVCAIHSEADTILSPAATKKQIEKLKGEGKSTNLILLKDGTTHYESGKYVPSLQTACTWLQGVWK